MMKRIPGLLPILLGWWIVGGLAASAAEDPTAATARKIHAEWQEAVVGVSAVAKVSLSAEGSGDMSINIPDREQKMEALGTIIDPRGLVVAALSQIDPSREIGNRQIRSGAGTIRFEANATLKEVRIIMPDGTDLPAEIVMKDADLDLAFIRARTESREAQGVTFKAIDLSQSARVEITDTVVSLSRMDELLNRQPSVSRGQVIALTKKPREFMRVTGASLGCPTFSLDGKLVGIAVNRSLQGKPSLTVLIPAADVLEIAEQARTANTPARAK